MSNTKTIEIGGWQFVMKRNSEVTAGNISFRKSGEILPAGLEIFPASVPGNFELDLAKAGKLPEDLFQGTNILKVQDLESMHLWYFTEFCIDADAARAAEGQDVYLRFGGIDTAAEIFLDGELIGTSENMFVPKEFPLTPEFIGAGPEVKHSLVVHIIPAMIYARNFELPGKCWAMKYGFDSLVVRKAPAMYGWDIMPRAVSAGLWKPVTLEFRPKERISSYYLATTGIWEGGAELLLKARVKTDRDDVRELKMSIHGECKDEKGSIISGFDAETGLFSVNHAFSVNVTDPKLWWPAGYGDPCLYDVTLTLSDQSGVLDTVCFRHGIRVVELERTSAAGKDGKFQFKVNGKRIFVLGSNWVPTDTFPSRIDDYTLRGLELVREIGCNMIRCWGGSPYPSDVLYDWCDSHGVMVWQDFAMACGLYPDDERMQKLLREEAICVVKALRGHASLALWSGDNENDIFASFRGVNLYGKYVHKIDPNHNKLTREILSDITERYDGMRPYIPSSPYLDEEISRTGAMPSEDHLWGPRDFFKGPFYGSTVCHFASETGYHGCPSPASLRRFISENSIEDFGDTQRCDNPEWLVHSASMEPVFDGAAFSYRVPLMSRQVERLFGNVPRDIETYALESQISQAEAMKYFIERFRIGKWYRTGIIWWNIIDGWPQISDAVVDWYGVRKLAFTYIQRSQQQFCLMCDEPETEGGPVTLCAANDFHTSKTVSYMVDDCLTGEKVLYGTANVDADSTLRIGGFRAQAGHYYLLRWSGDVRGINHFCGDIGAGVKLPAYRAFMQNAGLWDKLEGFDR